MQRRNQSIFIRQYRSNINVREHLSTLFCIEESLHDSGAVIHGSQSPGERTKFFISSRGSVLKTALKFRRARGEECKTADP